MRVDVSFDFAKVYNIERFDVVIGQNFTLLSDFDNGKWFSDNDPVLSLRVNGKDVDAKAVEKGTTTILIMNTEHVIQKTLTINVVDEILPMAASLGVTAGTPVPK